MEGTVFLLTFASTEGEGFLLEGVVSLLTFPSKEGIGLGRFPSPSFEGEGTARHPSLKHWKPYV